MQNSSLPIVNPKAKYHVFIGTDFSRGSLPRFDVCKYSLQSLSSEDISIIPCLPERKLLIPSVCLENDLKGLALYIPDTCLFKTDVIEMFSNITDDYMIWCTKNTKTDKKPWQEFMVFNLNIPKLYQKLHKDAIKWKKIYTERMHYITKSDRMIDLEVGTIPKSWQVIPEKFDKISYEDINCINFYEEGPWDKPMVKFAKDWYKEYKLYLNNVTLKECVKYS